LRHLHNEVEDSSDAQQLQECLLAYGQWLAQLTLGEQQELEDELRGLPADEQVERVRRLVRRENRRASRRLSADDAKKLRRAVLELVEERRSVVLQEMGRRGAPDRARRLEGPRGAFIILSWALQNEEGAQEARERIVSQLSAEAQDHLERLGPRLRQLQLWQWIRDSLQANWTPGELESFFAKELDNDQRAWLLNLPPGEMQAELERLYMDSQLGIRGGFAPGGGPWNPPGPKRPPFRPEMGKRGRPDGPPPPGFHERDRFEGRPNGPPRPRRGERDDRRPPDSPGPPPPPPPERQDAI
jgi:hypothetical protein